MVSYIKHECTSERDPSIIKWSDMSDKWCFEVGDGYVDIYYCPYCGVKLE